MVATERGRYSGTRVDGEQDPSADRTDAVRHEQKVDGLLSLSTARVKIALVIDSLPRGQEANLLRQALQETEGHFYRLRSEVRNPRKRSDG